MPHNPSKREHMQFLAALCRYHFAAVEDEREKKALFAMLNALLLAKNSHTVQWAVDNRIITKDASIPPNPVYDGLHTASASHPLTYVIDESGLWRSGVVHGSASSECDMASSANVKRCGVCQRVIRLCTCGRLNTIDAVPKPPMKQ